MDPERRQKKVDRRMKKKEHRCMKEEEMYEEVLQYLNTDWVPKQREILIRKLIRRDVKEIIKKEKAEESYGDTSSDSEESEQDWERKIENKVMYGSDSDRDIEEYVMGKETPQGALEYDGDATDSLSDEDSDSAFRKMIDGQVNSESEEVLEFEKKSSVVSHHKPSVKSKKHNQIGDENENTALNNSD